MLLLQLLKRPLDARVPEEQPRVEELLAEALTLRNRMRTMMCRSRNNKTNLQIQVPMVDKSMHHVPSEVPMGLVVIPMGLLVGLVVAADDLGTMA